MCKSQTWKIENGFDFCQQYSRRDNSSFTVKKHSSEKLVNDKNQN